MGSLAHRSLLSTWERRSGSDDILRRAATAPAIKAGKCKWHDAIHTAPYRSFLEGLVVAACSDLRDHRSSKVERKQSKAKEKGNTEEARAWLLVRRICYFDFRCPPSTRVDHSVFLRLSSCPAAMPCAFSLSARA